MLPFSRMEQQVLGSSAQLQGYSSQPRQIPTAIGTKYYTAPSCWHGGNRSHQMFAVSETSGGGEFTAPKNIQKGTDWAKPDTKQEEQPRVQGRGHFQVSLVHTMNGAGAESQCLALPLKGSLKQCHHPILVPAECHQSWGHYVKV